MTDNEKQGIRELVDEARGLCDRLLDIEEDLYSRYGISCNIKPDTAMTVPQTLYGLIAGTNIQCFRGIEKMLEATGTEGLVTDDYREAKRGIYHGDTLILQLRKYRGFIKAAKRDNKYTREENCCKTCVGEDYCPDRNDKYEECDGYIEKPDKEDKA